MKTISYYEFKSQFKSIKAVLIIALLLVVTLGSAKLFQSFQVQTKELGFDGMYIAGLVALLTIAGPLFVSALSHDSINRETHTRTMRFLVTKVSRAEIVIGKFIGMFAFWVVCLAVVSLALIPFSGTFYVREYIVILLFMAYFCGLFLFLSTVITKPSLSLFIGTVLAIGLPVVGFWGLVDNSNVVIRFVNYVMPYFYFDETTGYLGYLVLPAMTALFVAASCWLVKGRDL